jgi:HEAT repeat protein
VREPGAGGRTTVAALGIFALTLAYFALFIRFGFNLDDEGTLLAQFYRTYLGELPYRDFHMGYTPSGHYFHAALFRLFGVSVVPLRCALAICHASVAALLFVIGRRLMPAAFAVLPAFAYCALMPFYPGEFASFNSPYPAWYVVLFWIAGFWMLLRFLEGGHLAWVAGSGVLAGLCFAFKPNVGLFQLACGGLVFLLVLEPPSGGRASRWQGALWWALALGVAGGLAVVFASQASARDVRIFLWPIAVVLSTLAARRAAGRADDSPAHGLLGSGLLYAAAMLVTVGPWAVLFLRALGTQRFGRQILFIGNGFEQFYYSEFHRAGSWDAMLVLAVLAVAAVGLLGRVRLLPPRLTIAAATGGALVVLVLACRAEMPEGFHAAVFSRAEDLSFTATLLVHWVALAAALPLLWKRRRSQRELTTLAVLVGALSMYLQLYPRSDFMHLIAAVPLTLVLAAALAARFTDWLPAAAGLRRVARVGLVGGALAFVGFRICPNLQAVLTWDHGPAWRPHVALGLDRMPVTLELGREPRLRTLHDTVAYIRANSAPGEAIFPFPAIEVICFLADRENATRHGYFFPGWPGHDVEAEVVSTLAARPPRLVVTLHAHQFFFLKAPVYYFALREFIERNYREVASFGDYAVLARRDVSDAELRVPPVSPRAGMAALEARYGAALRGAGGARLAAARALARERLDFAWEPVVSLLDDPDPSIRAAALAALESATDEDVALVLATAFQRGKVPHGRRLAVLRRIWSFADARVSRPLIEVVPRLVDGRERAAALGALEAIGEKLAIRDYWFGEAPDLDHSLRELCARRLWRRRLASADEDTRLRMFLARVLPRLDGGTVAPALRETMQSDWLDLRIAAAAGLLRLGDRARLDRLDARLDLLDVLVPLMVHKTMYVPSLILKLYRYDPGTVRRRLAQVLEGPFPLDQEAAAWIVAATADPHFRAPLVRALASPDRMLRMAALFGLERIADPRTRRAIARETLDSDYEVREFAVRALAALPPTRGQAALEGAARVEAVRDAGR